jgi:SAM-dependent methyltransferase
MNRYSYSSSTKGLYDRLRELTHLTRRASRSAEGSAAWFLRRAQNVETAIHERTGMRLEGRRGLEIGPGQSAGCLRYFSLHNDVVGIDTDAIVQGFDPAAYLDMLRHNTFMRNVKTLGRKALRVDARFNEALARGLNVPQLPALNMMRMSATDMTFDDGTFDFVYSHSVFEHIDEPEAALSEIRRVLRPGGASYVSIHLYTSHSGSHDPRVLAEDPPRPPLWPHLRDHLRQTVRPNTFLNRLSLCQWRELFDRIMPGSKFLYERHDEGMSEGLRRLRESGELEAYTDEELLTVDFVAVWQKAA